MLSILLSIFKLIGIAILILLLIILILLILVLFVPIVYRSRGEKQDEDYDFHFKFSWFGFLVKGSADFTKVDGLSYKVKLLWKTLVSSDSIEDSPDLKGKSEISSSHSKGSEEDIGRNRLKENPQHAVDEQDSLEKRIEALEDRRDSQGNLESEIQTDSVIQKGSEIQKDPVTQNESEFQTESEEGSSSENGRKHKYFYEYLIDFTDFMISAGEIIYEKLTVFCDKIHRGLWKTAQILEYLSDSRFQTGLQQILKETKRLLWHIRPRKGSIWIHFGFEDPCTTGQVLGVLSILRSRMKKVLRYQSEFDREVLDLNMNCKGKLQVYVVLIIAAKLFFSKNVTFLRKGPFPSEDSK